MRNAAIQGIGLLIVCSSAAFGELGDELVGRNLLAADHAEFVGFFIDTLPTRTQRGVSTGISWKF